MNHQIVETGAVSQAEGRSLSVAGKVDQSLTVLEFAESYAAAGISVIPIRTDGSKAPTRPWKQYQERLATAHELRVMFSTGVGIAAIAGAVSGNLEVIDFEAEAPFAEWFSLIESLLPELAPALVIVETPSGGRHVYYRCQERIEGNQQLAMRIVRGERKVLIETRGEGGYVVAPGSPATCHREGRCYSLLQGDLVPGGGERSIPRVTADVRSCLLDSARSFNEVSEIVREPWHQQYRPDFAGRPGDIFNAKADWKEILVPSGWKIVGNSGEKTLWRRSGKLFGVSATTNYKGSDLLYVFSTNAGPLESGRSYDKFAAFTLLEHGGDFKAAAKAAAARYSVEHAQDEFSGAARRNAETADVHDRDEDGERAAFNFSEAAVNSVPYFAITASDSFVTRYVDYARQRTDAPPEAHELMSIGVLSALAGPKPRLPLATSIDGVPLAIWTLYCVNSTEGRKTTTINLALDMVIETMGREGVLYWEGSPQGILQRLQVRDGMPAVFARDEYSGLLGQMNRAGGHMAGLAQMFIRAYDGVPLENVRTRKRENGKLQDDTDRVIQPYLVKLCASTWDSFVTRATIDNVLDGFLARFAVFSGTADPQPQKKVTPELRTLRLSLIRHAQEFHEKCRHIQSVDVDEDVLALAWDLEREWSKTAVESSRPEAAGPALKRLAETVLKAAGLLAIDEARLRQVAVIRGHHFEAARQIGGRWLKSTLKLIDALGRSEFQKNCESVLATIRQNPGGLKVREVYRKHRRLNTREFADVLSALQTQDEINVTETDSKKGPASKFVIATRGAS